MTYNYPTVLVLLGATGDLATRKLLPSLYDLYCQNELPEHVHIIGAARTEMDDSAYRAFVREALAEETTEAACLDDFLTHIRYVSGDFTTDPFYDTVTDAIHAYNETIGQCPNVLYYLAVPPSLYSVMFEQLARNESLDICAGTDAWARLLVEKPFGRNVATAHALEEQLGELFADEQIYRIDHYLAKSAIENVLALRFGNSLVQNAWKAECIESINVRLYEDIDVGSRGSFYDGVGALRDVGQNHLLQLLALLLIPAVDVRDAAAVRTARAEVVDALRFDSTTRPAVRAQYDGYRSVDGVAPESETETFFAFALKSVAPEWLDVDMTVAAGKALGDVRQEVVVTFRPADLERVGLTCAGDTHTNKLRIIFKPEPRLCVQLATRDTGHELVVRSHEYELVTGAEAAEGTGAYERVLLDAIRGQQFRFVSRDEVMAAWRLMETVWQELSATPLQTYQPGTPGDDVARQTV